MNFFEGSLTGSHGGFGKFSNENFEKSDIRLVSTEKEKGAPVRLGIRPHHLELSTSGIIQGTVTMIERLGTETVVELATVGKFPFRYVASGSVNLSIGDSANFNFDPEIAHLF